MSEDGSALMDADTRGGGAEADAADAAALTRLDADMSGMWEEEQGGRGDAPALPAHLAIGLPRLSANVMRLLEAQSSKSPMFAEGDRADAATVVGTPRDPPPPPPATGRSALRRRSAALKASANVSAAATDRANRPLPAEALGQLCTWLRTPEHYRWPYPSSTCLAPCRSKGRRTQRSARVVTAAERERLARDAGISVRQVMNWLTNARKRVWKVR